jgi:hypothetical protein
MTRYVVNHSRLASHVTGLKAGDQPVAAKKRVLLRPPFGGVPGPAMTGTAGLGEIPLNAIFQS